MNENDETLATDALGTDNDLQAETVNGFTGGEKDIRLSRMLLEHPNVCALLGDLLGGMDEDEAIGRNLRTWHKKLELAALPDSEDNKTDAKLLRMINSLGSGTALADVMKLLRQGEKFDTAIAEAEAQGYVKGKNEKIDLLKNNRLQSIPQDGETTDPGIFPRYTRKSIWDNEK